MSINTNGWLNGVKAMASPNCNPRPDGSCINLIVIHGISLPPNEYGGGYIHQLFTNQLDPLQHEYFAQIEGMQVSAHCLIERTGSITQFVSFDESAWHAGVSCWQGQERCNDFSVGIELEGTDEDIYEDVQYHQLAELVITLRKQYPAITRQSICGHSDIAPGRKTDPGPNFNWQLLNSNIENNDIP